MFCNYCGARVTDDSNFCNKCGKRLISETHLTSNSKIHTVKIFRESQAFLINPPINISINNKEYLSIENGKTISLQLEEGDYEFVFYQSFRKKTISLNLKKDININLRWNRLTGHIEASILEQ